jgi:hypothetical protein
VGVVEPDVAVESPSQGGGRRGQKGRKVLM